MRDGFEIRRADNGGLIALVEDWALAVQLRDGQRRAGVACFVQSVRYTLASKDAQRHSVA